MQRRHPAAVDGINVGTVAGQDVHCSLRRVLHTQVETRRSFHLDREGETQILLLFQTVKRFSWDLYLSFVDTLYQLRCTFALTSAPRSQSSRRQRPACLSALALLSSYLALLVRTLGQLIINECRAVWPRWFLEVSHEPDRKTKFCSCAGSRYYETSELTQPDLTTLSFSFLFVCLFCRMLIDDTIELSANMLLFFSLTLWVVWALKDQDVFPWWRTSKLVAILILFTHWCLYWPDVRVCACQQQAQQTLDISVGRSQMKGRGGMILRPQSWHHGRMRQSKLGKAQPRHLYFQFSSKLSHWKTCAQWLGQRLCSS